jgi:hypothetical protein
VNIGSGATFTGGLGYPGGSITFDLSDPNAGDVLALTSAADGTVSGAISVDPDGSVYLGNGTSRDLIGNVDAIQNGQNGQPLTINFIGTSTGVFSDSSFESDDPTTGWASEWTVVEGRVVLGVDNIAGHPSPADTTHPIGNDGTTVSPGDGGPMTDPLVFDVQVATGAGNASDGARGLRLFSGDDTGDSGSANSEPYGVIHGPYVYSDPFGAQAGDILRFDWKAQGGDDAFDAFGYLLNADTGETIVCLDQSGTSTGSTTDWATVSVTVPTNGNWQFVFVSGAFDWSGGQKTGGSLYIDNFTVERSQVTDAILQTIANQVTYENTGDAALDDRTLTVGVTDGTGLEQQANTDLDVTNADDAPTGGVTVAGTAEQGAVLTASNDIADPDGPDPLTIAYQWQRQDANGTWVNIDGATGATYTLTQDDVGHEVRAVASYTDAGGTPTSLNSNETAAVANDDPAGSVAVAGTATQGEVLTASNDISDIDGPDPLTIAYQWQREVSPGNWVNIDGATAANYTLTQDDVGHAVRAVGSYTDANGEGGQVVSNETAAVANINDTPVAGDDSFNVPEDTATVLDVLANDVDVDGDTRQITHVNGVAITAGIPVALADGTVTLNDEGKLLFTPDAEFNGPVSFDYMIDDGNGETSTGTVDLNVTAVNDAPVSVNDSFTATADGSSVTLDVVANDVDADGDLPRITQIDGRAIAPGGSLEVVGGLVTLNADGDLVFTASMTFDGTAQFTYTVDDGHGGTATGTVSGDVTATGTWGEVGDQLDALLGELGVTQPNYVNNLLYIASVVSPGAFNLTDGSDGTGVGYHMGLGYELTPSAATPDMASLSRSLAALIEAQQGSNAPGLLAGDDGSGWSSAVDQSLLFQSKLATSTAVDIDYGTGGAEFSDLASQGWSRQFAQMALRADFSESLVIQSDARAQGHLHQVTVGQGAELAVNIGGQAAGAPQAALSNGFGMADFVTADGNSGVEVARAVAVAATVDGSDDQTAIVRMRQGGTLDLELQFYKVDDFTGAIGGLRPGEAGYAAAASARAYQTGDGSTWLSGGGFGKYSEGTVVGIDHDDLIAMRLSNGTQEFFAFAQANETVNGQNVGHLWSYGLNTWGWEDLAGGGDRDFNDLIVQLDFTSAHTDQVL